MIRSALVAALLGGGGLAAYAEGPGKKIHSPPEMMKLIEASTLAYTLSVLKEPVSSKIDGAVVGDDLFLKTEKGRRTLARYSLSRGASTQLEKAEHAFRERRWDEAMRLYEAVRQSSPDYGHVHVLIGDVHYKRGDYRQARAAFERAIRMNFIDYQAHWFLADTLWQLRERARAVEELALAHVLNVNHRELKNVLLRYRRELGRPWKEWTFVPQIRLAAKSKTEILVEATPDWVGYALVKAYWKFEPGYADKMAGPDYRKHVVCNTEEKEAVLALLTRPGAFPHLERIVKEGFFQELVLYEMAARRAPSGILLLPQQELARLVTYLGRYH